MVADTELSSWIGKRVKLVFDSGSNRVIVIHGKIISVSTTFITIHDDETNSPHTIRVDRLIRIEGEENKDLGGAPM